MLRSFRVENHKSIRAEAEFQLTPVYDRDRAVLPVAAIFGANAAGKSNVLDALRWMRDAVVSSFRSWEPNRGVPRTPFKLDPASRTAPSLYVTELAIENVRYTYGFTVDDEHVLEEWLYTYPHNRKRVVFARGTDGWDFGSTVDRAKLEQVAGLTPRNGLFLSTAARTEVDEVAAVFRWFQESLAFIDPTTSWRKEFDERLNGPQHKALVELVRVADLGIRDIKIDRTEHGTASRELDLALARPDEAEEKRAQLLRRDTRDEQTRDELGDLEAKTRQLAGRLAAIYENLRLSNAGRPVFAHGDGGAFLSEQEQSFGTLAWLRVLTHAVGTIESGSVLCVDEIDSSLHPRLTARLIELFRNEKTNDKGAQLIFTTHDATLLGTSFGDEILRRDEVWFVEKDEAGATRLYALADFKPRKEENTERRYLGGSYGAVPAVFSDTLVERYLAARQGQADDET